MPAAGFVRAGAIVLIAALATFRAVEVQAQLGTLMHIARGSFVDAVKEGEEAVVGAANRTTSNLAPLCYAYYKLRRYDRLFTCAAELESRIAVGDREVSGFMVLASDAGALPHALRANAFLELGDPRRSIEDGERALSLVRDGYETGFFNRAQYYVDLLPTLCIAAATLGRRAEAERYIAMLESIDISFIGGLHRQNLRNVGLGMMYAAIGEHRKAIGFLTQGEEGTISRVLGDIFLGAGESLASFYELPRAVTIGKLLLELGRIDEARSAIDQVIGHPRSAEYGDIYWVALYLRGQIAERDNDPTAAISHYRRAIDVIEDLRARLTTEATKIGFVGNKERVYARAISLLVADGQAAAAFEYVERSKARALVDLLAGRTGVAPQGANVARDGDAVVELHRSQLNAVVPHERADGSSTRSSRNLRIELGNVSPALASLVTVVPTRAPEIRQLLSEEEVLIEYYYDESTVYAFLLSRGVDVRAVRLERRGLEDAVRELRHEMTQPGGDGYRRPARELHKRLIEPIRPFLGQMKLVLVPHGVLHYVPFAALLGTDGGALIDRHPFRLEPSASVLKLHAPAGSRPSGPSRMLVLGNPDLGDPKLDLAFAEGEARDLAGMNPESKLLLRKAASETEFRRNAGSYTSIHFATHGQFRAESPLDSGLFLARDEANDGVLRVSELYSIRLNAELVTLSACETALGKVDNGDDVVGLTRGFLYAGARSIVSSLWSVDDGATAALMRAFYANTRTMNRSDALRGAQLSTRNRHPHPYYWSAFQLTGPPD